MHKILKTIISIFIILLGFLVARFIIIIPPLGILFLFTTILTFYILPLAWLASVILWLVLEKSKSKFVSIILLFTMILSFKLGVLWLTWASMFVLSMATILLIVKWWKQHKNILLKLLFVILLIILINNLVAMSNPFVSFFGFFGSSELIILNIQQGNPCQSCNVEEWSCEADSKTSCDNFDNTKNCYCCECTKNLKNCKDCFLFWDNSHRCNPKTNRCNVGW